MARFAVIHMTQQLKHMTQSRALKISLFQSHGAWEGKQGLATCRFYQLEGRQDCAGAFALNREGVSK